MLIPDRIGVAASLEPANYKLASEAERRSQKEKHAHREKEKGREKEEGETERENVRAAHMCENEKERDIEKEKEIKTEFAATLSASGYSRENANAPSTRTRFSRETHCVASAIN